MQLGDFYRTDCWQCNIIELWLQESNEYDTDNEKKLIWECVNNAKIMQQCDNFIVDYW